MYECLTYFLNFVDIAKWIAIDLGKNFKTDKRDKNKLMITGESS